ncbi:MAG: septum formation inhibitor Maf [Proteobacteria bacterium]|nr:septum formation inhibitor Maf [Pseudomonadota bacterium]
MALPENRIYLASRSRRRRELLKQIGVNFEILLMRVTLPRSVDVDETPKKGESPTDYVCRIARAKAEAGWKRLVQRGLPLKPLLVADTVVAFKGRIFGKPENPAHAEEILTALSGQTHQVLTSVAVAAQNKIQECLSTTVVRLRDISQSEIRSYLTSGESSGESYNKAGAYAIQGKAAVFIMEISGSYSGILGLPLFETAQLLEKFNIKIFS